MSARGLPPQTGARRFAFPCWRATEVTFNKGRCRPRRGKKVASPSACCRELCCCPAASGRKKWTPKPCPDSGRHFGTTRASRNCPCRLCGPRIAPGIWARFRRHPVDQDRCPHESRQAGLDKRIPADVFQVLAAALGEKKRYIVELLSKAPGTCQPPPGRQSQRQSAPGNSIAPTRQLLEACADTGACRRCCAGAAATLHAATPSRPRSGGRSHSLRTERHPQRPPALALPIAAACVDQATVVTAGRPGPATASKPKLWAASPPPPLSMPPPFAAPAATRPSCCAKSLLPLSPPASPKSHLPLPCGHCTAAARAPTSPMAAGRTRAGGDAPELGAGASTSRGGMSWRRWSVYGATRPHRG